MSKADTPLKKAQRNGVLIYTTLMKHSHDIIILLTGDGSILELNQPAEEYYDWQRDKVIGKKYHILCKGNKKLLPLNITDINKSKPVEKIEHAFILKDGQVNTMQWSVIDLAISVNQDDCRFILIGRNISQKITEKQHQQIQNYLEELSSTMPGNFYWKSKDGRYLGCNKAVLQMLGFKSESDLVGKTDMDLWPEQAEELKKHDQKVMKAARPIFLEEVVNMPGAGKMYFTVIKMPLLNEKGKVVGIIGNSFNITELKNTQAALHEAKELAERASQSKSEFIANMSHDMRTPLAGMLGFAEAIAETSKEPKIKEYAGYLLAANQHLLNLLNDILEATRLDVGYLYKINNDINLHRLFDELKALFVPAVLSKKLSIEVNCDPKIPNHLYGNAILLHRILLNLLSNAIKFTHKGEIKLSAERIEEKNNILTVRFTISDTGIGMAKDKVDSIFEPFARLSSSYEGIYKGAGLGLHIVKRFIENLQGSVEVETELNKGTTFIVTVPLKIKVESRDIVAASEFISEELAGQKSNSLVDKTTVQPKSSRAVTKFNILVVEDDILSVKLAIMRLEQLHCCVDIAHSGQAAIDLVNENSYDLIFMDIGLPDLSGFEVSRIIRSNQALTGKHTPIIALTAHAEADEKSQSLNVGIDMVLTKPLSKKTISEVIAKFLHSSASDIKLTSSTKATKNSNLINDLFKLPSLVVDIRLGKKIMNGNEKLAKQIIKELVDSLPEVFADLQAAYKKQNWDIIQKIVHKLHGGAAYCGTPRLKAACSYLEHYLKSKQVDLRDKLYKQVIQEIKALNNTFKS